MENKTKIWIAAIVLGLMHLGLLFAGFIAPYAPVTQCRDLPYVPPTRLHFVDRSGHIHLRPFVYEWIERPETLNEYVESPENAYPVKFLVEGPKYRIAGLISAHTHLFGVELPGHIFLAGSDNYGRDQFSRILYGGQISLGAGLLATVLSLALGTLLGSISGFYGRWIDDLIMGTAELFLVLPWLYLLLAVRAFLPLHISPAQAFSLLVVLIGVIGWARPSRIIRGILLSAKERKYVVASRGFGASNSYILRRHLLPQTYGVLLTQAALLIPQYMLAEVTLSFFGLGVSEPVSSWGTLLATLQQYNVLVSYWWMFAPGLALASFSFMYLILANAFHQQLESSSI